MGRHRNYGGTGTHVPPGPIDEMLSLKHTLTAAQILALVGTPVELVPAPGVGWAIIPFGMLFDFHPGGTPFINGSDSHVTIGPLANAHNVRTLDIAFVTNASDTTLETNDPQPGFVQGPRTEFENKNLVITATGAAYLNGTGTLTITVFYSLAQLD